MTLYDFEKRQLINLSNLQSRSTKHLIHYTSKTCNQSELVLLVTSMNKSVNAFWNFFDLKLNSNPDSKRVLIKKKVNLHLSKIHLEKLFVTYYVEK